MLGERSSATAAAAIHVVVQEELKCQTQPARPIDYRANYPYLVQNFKKKNIGKF